MCFKSLISLALVFGLWLLVPNDPALAGEAPANCDIQAIRAYFYFQEAGRFGGLDLFEPSRTLWNTPIGGGDAGQPSTVTLVSVTLSGTGLGGGAKGAIELIATADGRKLLTQSVSLSSLYGRSGIVTVPFLVFGTGCEELVLQARIVGVRSERRAMRKIVPFACGE